MLRARGSQIWIDFWEIGVGDSIVERINQGIAASDYLLALLSPRSVTSRWVREEINAALLTTIEQKGAKLLPVLLEPCELPPLLATRKYADFSSPETRHIGLEALFAAMRIPADVAAPFLLPDEAAVLNILRGKPDIRWTVRLITSRLASTGQPTGSVSVDVDTAVESLRRQGYLWMDKAGIVEVTEKTIQLFRSRGRDEGV